MEEDGEIPDPYVKLYLLPDRSRDSKRKTDVMKDNASPVFDERFEYSVAPNELTQRTLQVSVINKKGFFHMQRSPVLGQVWLKIFKDAPLPHSLVLFYVKLNKVAFIIIII